MAGRQGHNARKGKQGFQRTGRSSAQPWFFNVPVLPNEPDPSTRVKSTPREDAQAGLLMLAPNAIMTGAIFAVYIPVGGSLAVASIAATLNIAAYIYSAYEISKYFVWRRKLKKQNEKTQ